MSIAHITMNCHHTVIKADSQVSTFRNLVSVNMSAVHNYTLLNITVSC